MTTPRQDIRNPQPPPSQRERLPWRHVPALLTSAPGRCRLRKMLLDPVEPILRKAAGVKRRALPRNHRLVAVTGSYGKTTTARAVRCALGLPVGPTAGPNARYALAWSLMRQPGRDAFSVFEVGIGSPGQMEPMARAFRPDIAVVTSVGGEHASAMRTLETTRDEKSRLVRALSPSGVAVLNGDDPNVRWMAGCSRGGVITFGYEDDNDVRAEGVELDWPHGTRLTISSGDWRATVTVRLVGRHSVLAILAGVAVAKAAGINLDSAIARLSTLAPSPARMEVVALNNGAHLLRDEHKSGLETIHAALDLFEQIPARRRLIVLGEMTEPPSPQRQHHVNVGRRVAPLVSRAILVGHTGKGFRTGLKQGGLPREAIIEGGFGWRGTYDALAGSLEPGDVVLIKGRHDQRLERVALALMGRQVRCDLPLCNTPLGRCDTCPMLETGWGNRQPVF